MGKQAVLVTGATGFLGGRLTGKLMEQGFPVRAFVRQVSNTAKLQAMGAEVHFGDLTDSASLALAMKGVAVVVHAAANTSADAQGGQLVTVEGSQNVITAAMQSGVTQLIYISSCSVYGVANCQPWQQIDEAGSLEERPADRGHYSHAKFKAEEVVLKAMHNGPLKITCLRPGTIWGPGGEIFTPMMGFNAGRRLVGIIGSGQFILPLVYLDNLVSAIIGCIDHPGAYDQVFNVVDSYQVDKRTYIRTVLKPLWPQAFFFYIPYWALYGAVWCQELALSALGRAPYLTRYRLASSQRPVVYDAGKIVKKLGWSAPIDFEEAVRAVLRFEKSKT